MLAIGGTESAIQQPAISGQHTTSQRSLSTPQLTSQLAGHQSTSHSIVQAYDTSVNWATAAI